MELLDPIDALMLSAELVSSPMHVAAVLIFSPPPGADADDYARSLHEDAIGPGEIDPRLRRHPHHGIDTALVWEWRESADIDLRHHVQRRTLPPGSGPEVLWELVSQLHAVRLDLSAPLWMAYLIDGLPDGRFAFYIKVHHIVLDGVAGMQLITKALSPDPDRRDMPAFFARMADDRPAPTPPPGLLAALAAIRKAAAAGAGLTRQVLAAEAATAVGSLVTRAVAAPFSAPRTRFNTRLGPRRAVAAGSVDRERVRAVAAAAGTTTNDVVTAMISGALRCWLIERGELPDRSLVAICPVSVRPRDDAAADTHGNQFGLGLCGLGTDLADPAQRLAMVHAAMSNVKNQVARHGPGAMLVTLAPAIGPTVLLPLLPFSTPVPPSYNLPISNVRGPQQPMYYNGARLDEIYPISVVYDGMALNVTSNSYADRIGVGYVADRDVLADVGALVPLTERALSDLEEAFGIDPRNGRAS